MTLRAVYLLLACLIVTAHSNSAMAAAWTLPYGEWQVIEQYSLYTTSFTNQFNSLDNQNSIQVKERFYKAEIKPSIEVGVRSDLTLGLAPTFQYVQASSPLGTAANYGLVNADIYARKRLWKDDVSVLSVQPLIKTYGFYDEEQQPFIGQKQVDVEARLLYGRAFETYDRWHFVNLEGAYRKRMEDPGDEVQLDATFGWRLTESWMVMPQIFATYSVDRDDESNVLALGSQDYDLIKTQFSVVKHITPEVAIQVGAYSHAYTRNTADGAGVVISLWKTF